MLAIRYLKASFSSSFKAPYSSSFKALCSSSKGSEGVLASVSVDAENRGGKQKKKLK